MVKKKRSGADQKTSIYLNGKFIGVHGDGASLAQRLREKRRSNERQAAKYLRAQNLLSNGPKEKPVPSLARAVCWRIAKGHLNYLDAPFGNIEGENERVRRYEVQERFVRDNAGKRLLCEALGYEPCRGPECELFRRGVGEHPGICMEFWAAFENNPQIVNIGA